MIQMLALLLLCPQGHVTVNLLVHSSVLIVAQQPGQHRHRFFVTQLHRLVIRRVLPVSLLSIWPDNVLSRVTSNLVLRSPGSGSLRKESRTNQGGGNPN